MFVAVVILHLLAFIWQSKVSSKTTLEVCNDFNDEVKLEGLVYYELNGAFFSFTLTSFTWSCEKEKVWASDHKRLIY